MLAIRSGLRAKVLMLVLSTGIVAARGVLLSANEILSLELTTDGSSAPPGDRLDVTVLLFPEVREAFLEVRAYMVSGADGDERTRVRAARSRNADPKRNFLLSDALRRGGKSVAPTLIGDEPADAAGQAIGRFDRRLVVPYEDLELSFGQHLLGYQVLLIADGRLVDAALSKLTTVTIGDGVRKEMLEIVSKHVSESREVTVDGHVWSGDKLASAAWATTVSVQKPVFETRVVPVSIPKEYRRDQVAENSVSATSNAFVPEPRRTVYFATNRTIANKNGGADKRFGNESVPAVDEMVYGSCVVTIPINNHVLGNIEEPGRVWWFWTEAPDPEKHFLIEKLGALEEADFYSKLAKNDVLLYVHGYNNTFKSAILHAAQFQHDLKFAGKMVAFSWPSAGSTLISFRNPYDHARAGVELAYKHDEVVAARSYAFLADVLDKLLSQHADATARPKVHVLAHSMGNRVLLHALHELKSQGKLKADNKLGEIILAAADVDGATFSNVRTALMESCEHVTFYYAPDDGALTLSQAVHVDKPVGLGPLFDKMMDTISAENLTRFFDKLGHVYVSESEPLLTDLRLLLTRKLPPLKRRPPLGPRMEMPTLNGEFYWTFLPIR